jgi:two-component system, chemotaxis family, protein-glutamate methylesterase/glutaminase
LTQLLEPPEKPTLQVLVIDDSAVVRETMMAILSREPDMRVTVASDAIIAIQKMRTLRPDVIVLDLDLPRMNGLTFLRKVLAEEPVPVVICSGLVDDGALALRALDEGAVAIVTKARLAVREFLTESAALVVDTVRGAAAARVSRLRRGARPLAPELPQPAPGHPPADRLVAVGASTGGTEAIREVLEAMPSNAPAMLIVQHMPEPFTAAFAASLNAACRIEVKEARTGDRVTRGLALVAPGNRHMVLRRSGPQYTVDVRGGPPVSRHRPSVDVLFGSVARAAGRGAVGVLLTGMGDDGAEGLLEMRNAGAATMVQDEASCVVFGMPRAAIARGAAAEVIPLSLISAALLRRATSSS